MTLMTDVLPKLRTPKKVVKQISIKTSFSGPLDKQHAKGDQTQLWSQRHYLDYISWSLRRQLSWKKYRLVIFKFLRLFVNTLTADEKYSFLNRDNFRQPTQMELSQKLKTFSESVSAFLKARLNFENFEEKHTPHSWCISETTDSEKHGPSNLWKVPFQSTLREATCKGDQTVLKSEPHHLCYIYWSLWRQLSWKKSLLGICKVLTMFLNILTGDDMYYLLNRDNLRQHIQMQLSQK